MLRIRDLIVTFKVLVGLDRDDVFSGCLSRTRELILKIMGWSFWIEMRRNYFIHPTVNVLNSPPKRAVETPHRSIGQ